jgi:formylglycine-generating enzyme required for sulfatase activity
MPATRIAAGWYDPALLAMIDAGLAVRPENRPQSIAQWRGARPDNAFTGARLLEGAATRVAAPFEPAPSSSSTPRRTWWIGTAAAVLLLLGGGAYYVIDQRARPTIADKAAEEKARAEADARRKAEDDARRRANEEMARAEADARRQAEDEARRRADEEKVRADARRKAEDDAKRRADEEKARAEADARRKAEDDAKRHADEEKARAEADARRKAEDEAKRRAGEEKARAEADAKRKADEDARRQAEASEAALRLSDADRRRVQVALTALGHDTGGTDGSFGPRTRQMIGVWQKKQNEPETGYLTAAQWALLQQQAASALAKHNEEISRRDKPAQPGPGTGTGAGNRDCAQCPEMVRLRPGAFQMGSTPADPEHEPDEAPQHRVTIGYAVALGKYEVTRAEFAAFVEASGHRTAGDWRNPGFNQTDRDPVVNVTWDDAQAYVAWLSRTTGKTYRLPTEAEWEYAARAGTATARYWGDSRADACRHANADDAAFGCSDGFKHTAPVGQFRSNGFGLHDMLGNVWEWTADCWNADHSGAPANGQARLSGDCARHTVRGGSWGSSSGDVRSAGRTRGPPSPRNFVGFRVARSD